MPEEEEERSAGSERVFSPGLRHMLLGVFFFSVMSVFTKLAGERLPSMEIVVARAVVTLAMSIVALRHLSIPIFGNRKGLLLARGAAGFVALSCFFYALTALPLADATVIQFTNPILTSFIAAFALKEAIGRRELLGGVASLVGVVLVARPSFLFGETVALDPWAVIVAAVGALFSAIAYVIVRRLGASEDPLVVVFYFPLVAGPASIPFLVFGEPLMPRGIEWLLLLGVGVFAQLGQIQLTKGLSVESAGRATSINYLQVALAYLWGMLLFAEMPTLWGVLGTACILLGLFTVHRSRKGARRDPPHRR